METRFGCLEPNLPTDSDARKLIKAAHLVIEAVMNTEVGQTDLWRYFPTKMYRQLCDNEDLMAGIVSKVLKEKLETKILEKGTDVQSSVIGQFFSDPKTTFGDVLATVLDLMLAGIDTTAFSSGFVLYYLARNQEKQEKLRKEISSIITSSSSNNPTSCSVNDFPSKDKNSNEVNCQNVLGHKNNPTPDSLGSNIPNINVTPEMISNMPYMKAVVKEAMRLAPLSIGIGRVTTQDTVIRNYLIPKDTMVVTQNQVSCQLEEYFDSPNHFIPERWLNLRRKNSTKKTTDTNPVLTMSKGSSCPGAVSREEVTNKRPHPFLALPFGYGPRSCPGKRISDMNTYVLLIKLLTNFRIEYHHDDIGMVTRLINIPDKPMKFRFIDIQEK